jgi:hypothetical protein
MHSPKKTPHLTYSQWARVGSDLKKMQNSLFELWFHSDLQQFLTKAQQEKGFGRIECGIRDIKCILEDKMFKDISRQYVDTHELLSVFYDSSSGLEPLPEPKRKNIGEVGE